MNRKKVLIPIMVFTIIIIFLIIASTKSNRYKKLSINENKWNSIKDTRTQNETLVLEDIEFNDYNLIIDEKNNTLYYSIVNSSRNKYNPNVSYNAGGKNVKMAILLDEITDKKVKSDYEFKVMIYNDQYYRIYNLKCTDLPILNITYKEEVKNKQKNILMEIYLFNNLSNMPNKITKSNGKLKINENSYVFSLNMITPGKNTRDNKISILNMKPNSEYVLTRVNNNMEENINKETREHRVELFINSEYVGTYFLEYNN